MTRRARQITIKTTTLLCVGLALACILLIPVWSFGISGTQERKLPAGSALVSKGTVDLTVEQAGELESSQNAVYVSNCEWRVNLVWIAPEGTKVQPGDVIVQLDQSVLQQRLEERQVRLMRAKADLEQAEAAYEIQKLLNESSEQAAILAARLAELDLESYDQGTFPMERLTLQQTIASAQENLVYLNKRIEYLKNLVQRGYKDQQTLEAERLKLIAAQQTFDTAAGQLDVLTKHTRARTITELTGLSRESQRDLERTGSMNRAALLTCEAKLYAARRSHELSILRLNRVERSLAACTIRARQAGEVVHVRAGFNDLPPEPGQEIYNLQQLVKLPDRSRMQVSLRLHESRVRSVTVGLPAVIRLDMLKGQRLTGRVTRVSTIPLAGQWPNIDRREYEVTVRLDPDQPGTEALAPGMTADVKILAGQRRDVISVPLSAAVTIAGEDYVFVRLGDSFEHRRVQVGLVSDSHAEIRSGLQVDEEIVVQPLIDCARLVDQIRDKAIQERAGEIFL